jgi:hypothetical protein
MPAISQSLQFDLTTLGVNTQTSVSIQMPQTYQGQPTFNKTLTFTSQQTPGAGYYNIPAGLHTVTYTIAGAFRGTCTMQATLATMPEDADWFDVYDTSIQYDGTETTGSTGLGTTSVSIPTKTDYLTFIGNFTWVRGKVDINNGTMLGIRYNF